MQRLKSYWTKATKPLIEGVRPLGHRLGARVQPLKEALLKASTTLSPWMRDLKILRPTIWLSGQLTFSRKYLLIGTVVFAAMTLLSVPILQRTASESRIAEQERDGLKTYVQQAHSLEALVNLRSQNEISVIDAKIDGQMAAIIARARQDGLSETAQKLEAQWTMVKAMAASDRKLRFTAITGSINTVLSLMRDSARQNRLSVDPELDASFDMLTSRLPLVIETLGKQRDVLSLRDADMASYALGAQVVLTESVPALKTGLSQLVQKEPSAERLSQSLSTLLSQILQQQDVADQALDSPAALSRLQNLTASNLHAALDLLDQVAASADSHLVHRIDELNTTRWIIWALLIGVSIAITYLFAGIYLSTQASLKSLSEGTEAFCGGRLDTRIEVETRDELVLIARNFNTVADEVQRLLGVIKEQNESRQAELETQVAVRTAELADRNELLHKASERVQEELDLARNMQQAILPHEFPDESDWAVSAAMYPARELGGDFYDCFHLSDGRYGILVADVAGKGVGAAFFMAVSRTVLQDLAMSGKSPAQVLARANTVLCERNPVELFVTALYAIYDPKDGSLIYASAGHHSPLVRRANGQIDALSCPCDIALGVLPDMPYSNQHGHLAPGDWILLYTDGITEAFDAHQEAYGDERLHAFMRRTPPEGSATHLIERLVQDVSTFVDGQEASDDLTCLILHRKQGAPHMQPSAPVLLKDKTERLHYKLPSRLDEIAKLAEAVETALDDRPDLVFAANLCLEELLTNTIIHGLKGEPDRVIEIFLNMSAEWLEIIIKDDAPGFDPFAEAPMPDLDLDIEDRPIGGLGVHIVRTIMDEAKAYFDGSGNLVVLLKALSKD